MEEVHVVMVLPSWEALGRMKADEVDLAPDDDNAEGVQVVLEYTTAVLRAMMHAAELHTRYLEMASPQGRPHSFVRASQHPGPSDTYVAVCVIQRASCNILTGRPMVIGH
jgi:hypothetical protein